MIRLANLEKWFPIGRRDRAYALRGVSLEVQEGEFVTIMGPSGAGKSTLLAILGMLDGAFSGEYFFLDQPVHGLKPKKRNELNKKYVGFVFQRFHLLDDLDVFENLEVPLTYRDMKKAERRARVEAILDRFAIGGKRHLYPGQLSGGEQQMVAIARAVIADPRLICADEPTGNLHTSQGQMIMDLLKELHDRGTTIVQVTHNEDWAAYGNRIVELVDGRLV